MLEKIENISRNKSYKHKRHSTSFDQYFNKDESSVRAGKDSIRLSPAALYLSSLKWNIRDIEYPSSDNIVFDFYIDEFEFRTKIDLADFFSAPQQLFIVTKTEINNNRMDKIVAAINIKKEIVKNLNVNSGANLQIFRELFERISALKNVNQNIDKKENLIFNNLVLGIEDKLFFEFTKIINSIYTFIYKHEKFQIPNQVKFKNNDIKLINIEEISTYYN